MDLDLDPFDVVAEPTARAGGKFQPKARPQPKKGKHVPATKLTNAAKDTPASATTVPEDSLHSVSVTQMAERMPFTAAPCESSTLNREQVNITKFSYPGNVRSNGENSSAPVDISSQPLASKVLDREDALHSELSISSIAGDLQSEFATLERESADIHFNSNDIIPESTISTAKKLQPRVKAKAKPENKLSDSCDGVAGAEDFSENAETPPVHKAKDNNLERGFGLHPCSLTLADTSLNLVSEETLNGTETGVLDHKEDFVVDSERLGGKEQVFSGLESLNVTPQTTTTGVVQLVTETEYTDEYAYPVPYIDDYVDPAYYSDDYVEPVSADNVSVNHSTVDVPLPAMPNHASEYSATECLTNHEDASRSNPVIPQEVVESEAIPPISRKEVKKTRRRKKVGFTVDDKTKKTDSKKAEEISQESPREGNLLETDVKDESGKSTRRLRKRSNGSVLRDKTKGGTKKVADLSTKPSIRSLEDEDGYSDGGDKDYEDTSHSKRKARKAKPAVQTEKSSRKRKKTSEGQDSNKEPPKKFSHTTRRNKRRVSKPLLETPVEEIDPRKSTKPSIRSLEDEDGYSDGGDKDYEDTSHSKRKARKAKPAVQTEKPSRKRKKTSEGQDSNKEPPKKFSRTTRRNKRRVSKALETPEEEIDPRKLPFKDLIPLAEFREQSLKKDSAVSKQSPPTQSVDNSFHKDTPYDAPFDDDDTFDSVGGDRDFQETERRKSNYHSYMKKTARIKWSKQNTELFYEAIRQFGTDFTMIQQLFFPDLDPDDGRRQLVLKYKNEEGRNPMRLHEAVTNRSKNHSYLEHVIEKLRKLNEDQNYDRDVESGGITGKEAEDNAPDTNDIAESHQKDIPDDTDATEIPEAYDLAESFHEAEDDYDYKYDDYNNYNYEDDYVG